MSKSRKQLYEERPRQAEPDAHRARREIQREIDELTRYDIDELEDEWDTYEDITTFEKIRKAPRK